MLRTDGRGLHMFSRMFAIATAAPVIGAAAALSSKPVTAAARRHPQDLRQPARHEAVHHLGRSKMRQDHVRSALVARPPRWSGGDPELPTVLCGAIAGS